MIVIVLSKLGVSCEVRKIVVGLFVLFMIVMVFVFFNVNLKLGIRFNVIVLNKVVKILNCVVVLSNNILGLVISVLKLVIVFMFIKMSRGNIFVFMLILYM